MKCYDLITMSIESEKKNQMGNTMSTKIQSPTLALAALILFSLQSCKEGKTVKPDRQTVENKADEDGFVQIFDGKTLKGWEGDPTYWSVENGNLTGKVTPETLLENNTFIVWQGGQPADFELKLEFRIAESGNSGINYRSEKIDTIPHALRGYQADIVTLPADAAPMVEKISTVDGVGDVSTTEIWVNPAFYRYMGGDYK